MTTADWALLISVISALISGAGFVWNVWSKFIYPKAKVRVSFNRMHTIDSQGRPKDQVVVLGAINFGPGPVTLRMAIACERWHWQRETVAILNPLDSFPNPIETNKGPFAGGLPKKLEVGEEHVAYFSTDAEFMQPEHASNLPYIGFHDIYGRSHLTRITPAKNSSKERPLGTPLTRAWKRLRKLRTRTTS